MRAWYDILGLDLGAGQDADGIHASAAAVEELMAAEFAQGIAPEKLILAGFSQGGVIALHLGLSFPQPLAGIMALSTYLHDPDHLAERLSLASADLPIFMAHGVSDAMIPISRAAASRQARPVMPAVFP